ncbi:hypothetical protein HYW17_02180 [Candidatus Uhrbacteria bacterium]|nr:hypothetical protein [Candidatus Uhrbacteria bacterium]
MLNGIGILARAMESGTPRHEGIVVIQYLEEVNMTAKAVLGSIVGIGVLMFFSSIFNGYALSVLWGWFVVPTFGASALHIVPAIGIAMVVRYLTYHMHDCKKEEKSFGEKIAEGTAMSVVKPSLALFFGWIVHLFM